MIRILNQCNLCKCIFKSHQKYSVSISDFFPPHARKPSFQKCEFRSQICGVSNNNQVRQAGRRTKTKQVLPVCVKGHRLKVATLPLAFEILDVSRNPRPPPNPSPTFPLYPLFNVVNAEIEETGSQSCTGSGSRRVQYLAYLQAQSLAL